MALSKLSYKPTLRERHVAVAVGHHQFTWGGYTGDWDKSKELARIVEVFDLSSERWEKRPTRGSPPPGYVHAAYTTIGTTLYSFGGYGGKSRYNSLHRLDLSSLEWEEVVPRNLSAAPKRKCHCQMLSFQDNKLVVFAGYTGEQWTDELHVFNLQEGTWSFLPTTGDKPPPRSHLTLTKIDDHRAVMFGGMHRLDDVFVLELGKWHWTKLEVSGRKPPARYSHAACCLAGLLEHPLLMVVGGWGVGALNDGWILDVDQRRWTKLDFPVEMEPRFEHTATVFGSAPGFRQVVLHGGKPSASGTMTATTLLNLELECGVWRVTGVILEDQLGKWPEEKLKERMERLWPSPPPTQQTSSRAGNSSNGHVQPSITLEEKDLVTLLDLLNDVSYRWISMGDHLGFTFGELTNIQHTPTLIPGGPSAFLRQLLSQWLKRAPPKHPWPTIEALASVLRAVGEERLANDLGEKFIRAKKAQ